MLIDAAMDAEIAPADPMLEALAASARYLGTQAEAEPLAARQERETRIWTSVTRLSGFGSAAAADRPSIPAWLMAAAVALGAALAGGGLTWFLIR